MKKGILKSKLFEARYFGYILGLFIFILIINLKGTEFLVQPQRWVQDFQIQQRGASLSSNPQFGVSQRNANPLANSDILILGVDNEALSKFGRWPWPRFRHADVLNNFTEITNQAFRESTVLLDFFFTDPSRESANDVILKNAIDKNQKTQLEGILVDSMDSPFIEDPEYQEAFISLLNKYGGITKIEGNTDIMPMYFGMESPLIPISQNLQGYGHATYIPDDDKLYRKVMLISRVALAQDIVDIDQLTYEEYLKKEKFEHYTYFSTDGYQYNIIANNKKEFNENIALAKSVIPPTVKSNEDNKSQANYYYVYRFKDVFVPSIVLSVACNYLNVKLTDVEFVPGKYIKLPSPKFTVVDENGKSTLKPFTDINGFEQKDLIIPVNEIGQMIINYVGPPSSTDTSAGSNSTFNIGSYSKYPIPGTHETLQLQNKIILAGAFSNGMADDEKNTPMGIMFGIEMQANAINGIITGNFITYLPEILSIIILFIAIMVTAFVSSRLSAILSIVVIFPLLAIFWYVSVKIFSSSSLSIDTFLPSLGMIVTMLFIIVYRVVTEEREKKRIHGMFGKYVSPAVVNQLLGVSSEPELGGVDKEITVFFSDIRGFTTLSESMSPQELVNHLNVYLTAMTDIIHEFNGTLDKYVGDEVMCFWGAPLPQQDHALLACKCALKQMAKLKELNQSWPAERRIDIGIGLNSGIMTVGNMGSLGRMNYTLMGDNVNLGARLEGTNKEYGTHIIISEFTYQMVKDKVIARELDNIRVKGKNKPVLIYELIEVID